MVQALVSMALCTRNLVDLAVCAAVKIATSTTVPWLPASASDMTLGLP